MFRTLDETACRYRAGQIGQDQVFELSRAFRNPRCGHQLAESEALLLAHERDPTARQFEFAVKHWLSVADAEGIKQRHDSLHKHRDIRITPQFDGGFKIDGTFGPEQGAAIKEIHDRHTETERLADWATARAEHGDNITPALLARTEAQRRRVVIGAPEASVSQKTRVFTGPLRRMIQTLDTTCVWAGCDIPSDRCQVDHVTPWRTTQNTSARNGAPLCGRHNRYKEHGYHTHRDTNGNWHIQRPDGTTITPAA